MAESHDVLVTLEENAIMGGAGSGVNEVLMANRKAVPVLNLGLPDHFIPQGTRTKPVRRLAWMRPALSRKSVPGLPDPSPFPLLLCLNVLFKKAGAEPCNTRH